MPGKAHFPMHNVTRGARVGIPGASPRPDSSAAAGSRFSGSPPNSIQMAIQQLFGQRQPGMQMTPEMIAQIVAGQNGEE